LKKENNPSTLCGWQQYGECWRSGAMKIGFLGAGKMAEAIMAGLIHAKHVEAHEIFASDLNTDRRAALKHDHNINTYSKNVLIPEMAEILFLAVKPQQMDEVLAEISGVVTEKHLVISIAAGRKLAGLEHALPGVRMVRVMPNLCCLVGQAMSAYCAGAKATAEDRKTVAGLLNCVGRAVELPEEQFDAVTALSGSGPAFFAFLMQAMAEAAVREGLTPEHARLLAAQTMLGTAKLLLEKDTPADELIASVRSAKGTTDAGLKILESSSIQSLLADVIQAAARRSRELAG
jgi:pyrroline-5-carboxylate reductase